MSRLIEYEDPAEFRRFAEPYLVRHEAENNLPLGLLSGICAGRYRDFHLSALAEKDGAVQAVAIRTPPYNLVLSRCGASVAAVLADAMAAAGVSVPGVSAPAEEAEAFARSWVAATSGAFEQVMSQRIYQLDSVLDVPAVAGSFREATAEDRPLLIEWLTAFEEEALAAEGGVRDTARAVDWALSDESDAGIVLWEDRGPVCLAGYAVSTPSGARIGPVYTPPEFRRRGYGTACVAGLSSRLLARGRRFCFLYTDLANETSNGIYRRIGYRPVADAAMIRFSV